MQLELFAAIIYHPRWNVLLNCPICKPKREKLVPIGANSYCCPACGYVARLGDVTFIERKP